MINRFEWLKAVLRSDLPDRAKAMAGALAVQFANDHDGQLNPARAALCAALGGWKDDTARRAIGDLERAGWLARSVGVGRGNACVYVLLSPGNVVALRPVQTAHKAKAVAVARAVKTQHDCGDKRKAKARTFAAKTPQNCRSPYKDEQTYEQTGARPSAHLSTFVEGGSWRALEWNKWLSDEGLRISLSELKALHVPGGYDLPRATPPARSDATGRAVALKVIAWARARGQANAA